jgi:D-sedoheptulose 7-phosphate isomerase
VFVEQLKNLASADDMLIAFSGSGNSANVLNATDWANHARLRTWGITGFDGGKLRDLAQESVHVALNDMGLVESIHLLLFHWILDDVHARIYAKGRHGQSSRRSTGTRRKVA